jgi:hypothetical protein
MAAIVARAALPFGAKPFNSIAAYAITMAKNTNQWQII